ncbi:MAG: hypothetical protein IKA06_00630 [Clostridia bacterium]|nr:hypothetical protein [Clostridia bacterium]
MNRKHENTELGTDNGEYAVRRSRLSLIVAAVVCLLLAVVVWLMVMNVKDSKKLPLEVVGAQAEYTYVLSDAELEVSGAVVFLKMAERIEVIVPEQATAPGTYVIALEDLVLPEGVSLSELTDLTLTVSKK